MAFPRAVRGFEMNAEPPRLRPVVATGMALGRAHVCGIAVDPCEGVEDACDRLFDGQNRPRTGVVLSVNPEFIVAARAEPRLVALAKAARFAYPDGIGVVMALLLRGVHTVRVPGVDLWERVNARAARSRTKVFLVGARSEIVARTAKRLAAEYPGLQIVGFRDGYFPPEAAPDVLAEIKAAAPSLVAVALGMPYQELFIAAAVRVHPDALYMGVGGTFDIYSGAVRRAPRLWRQAGLEWLYRLLTQPHRWRRFLRLPTFVWMLLTARDVRADHGDGACTFEPPDAPSDAGASPPRRHYD